MYSLKAHLELRALPEVSPFLAVRTETSQALIDFTCAIIVMQRLWHKVTVITSFRLSPVGALFGNGQRRMARPT